MLADKQDVFPRPVCVMVTMLAIRLVNMTNMANTVPGEEVRGRFFMTSNTASGIAETVLFVAVRSEAMTS